MKRNILLNPGPATTTNTVKQALVVPDICPREEEFGEITQSVLEKIVKVINGQKTHSTVIFAGSGTAGVEAALSSVIPENGKILIDDLNNTEKFKNAKRIAQAQTFTGCVAIILVVATFADTIVDQFFTLTW